MDTMNEEAFRINPQCTLINANNPFMAWRVEPVRQNRRAAMTFSGFARVSFPPRVRARNCVIEVKLTLSGRYWPVLSLVLKEIKPHLFVNVGSGRIDERLHR